MPERYIENSIDRAVQLGQNNQRLIELTQAHCANARVVREGGAGMVEAHTGLPIGIRSIRCDYAATPGGVANNLAFLVEDFYRGNCVGCPHRRIRGLPNLATWCEERAAEQARHTETERQVAEKHQQSLKSRQAVRRLLRLTENDAGRELLNLLDRLDAHKPSEEDYQDAEERLVATIRSAPVFLSQGIIDALFAVAETGEPAALRSLTIWSDQAPRIVDRLLHIAVHLLANEQNLHAAEVFTQIADRATSQDVEQIIDSLMDLAAQVIPWELDAQPAGLLAAARVSLSVVLDVICRYLEGYRHGDEVDQSGPSPTIIAIGGCAAEHLIHQEPGTASVLVPKLLEALPQTMYIHEPHPHPDSLPHAIIRALRAAFHMRPEETADAVDRVAMLRSVEERKRLFWIYADVLDPRDGTATLMEVRVVALARVVARAMGDWGLEVAATAAIDVEHLAASTPSELVGLGRALIGTLLCALNESGDLSPRIEALVDPERRLEEESRRAVRVRWIRSLAVAVGHMIRTDAEFAEVMALYDATITEGIGTTDAARELRRRLLHAFPALAASPGQAARLMPRLYSALLDKDVGIRATAIDACHRWTTNPGYALPELVHAFVPTLLDDTYVAVHRAMIRAISAVPPLHKDMRRVVLSLLHWANTYVTKDPNLSSDAAIAAVRFACTFGPDAASSVVGFALNVVKQFDNPWDTHDVLHASAPYADHHPVWAQLAVRLLATRHWLDSGDFDPFIRRRLLEMSDITLATALEEIDSALTACLPDHPAMAWGWIEVLQAAGMWEKADRLASRIVEQIPCTAEYKSRLQYAHVMHTAVTTETALANGDTTSARQLVISITGESNAPKRLIRWRAARCLTVEALGSDIPFIDRADRLQVAAARLRAIVSHQPTDHRRRAVEAYCRTLELLADLAHWDTATQAAEENADRWRQAAMRKAELAASDVEGTALTSLVERIRTINQLGVIDELRLSLIVVPLPVLITNSPYSVRTHDETERPPHPPVGVCLLEMDGTPVSRLVLLEPEHIYDLRVTIHVSIWPDWAETLEIAFNSPTKALELPVLTLRRPTSITTTRTSVIVSGLGQCWLAGTQSSFANPLVCDVIAEFHGGNQQQLLRVAGWPQLRVRTFDPARDAPYGQLHTEGELITFFDQLYGQGVPDNEVKVFCRFFSALVAAAKQLYANRQFRGGGRMREAQFQHELEKILSVDPRLGGRIQRKVLAGGVTDLIHDGIVAELKVERTTPATIAEAHKYIGQPAQYSVDADARLSILCVLDWTKKNAPVGKPENYWGWLIPQMHGIQHSSHSSIVGILIVNTNLPRPSSWSRHRINASALNVGASKAGFMDGD